METVAAAIVAVVGTLLGSVVTSVLQARHHANFEQSRRARESRDAYVRVFAEFARRNAELRGIQILRWTAGQEFGSASAEYVARRDASYAAQSEARGAMYQVELVCDDERVANLARDALEATIQILDAADEEALGAAADKSRSAGAVFLQAARSRLRS